MVHLVAERPRDALLPVLLEQCRNPALRRGYSKHIVKREPWWRTVFPVYYELFYICCNSVFLLGSVLFLPIFEEFENSVSFSMAVLNLDKAELLRANRTLLDSFEGNIMKAIAEEAGHEMRPGNAHLVWHSTKSCELNEAVVLDSTIFPPEGVNVTHLKERLSSSETLPLTVNRSIGSVAKIETVTTGPVRVKILSGPFIVNTARRGRWAIDCGCYLYITGSFCLALLSAYDLLEDILTCCFPPGLSITDDTPSNDSTPSPSRTNTRRSLACSTPPQPVPRSATHVSEKAFYLVGSLIFLMGTLYFQHPKLVASSVPSVTEAGVLNMAIALFILGSVTFVFAAFLNALSLTVGHVTFANWAVAVCGIYEAGGILFVMGSVCFLPNQGCGKSMEILGACFFIIGSCCYIFGGCLEVVKTVALLFLKRQQEDAAKKIAGAYSNILNKRRLASPPSLLSSTGNMERPPPEPRLLVASLDDELENEMQRIEHEEEQMEEGSSESDVGEAEEVAWEQSREGLPSLRLRRQLYRHAPGDTESPRRRSWSTGEEAEHEVLPPGLWTTFFQAMAADHELPNKKPTHRRVSRCSSGASAGLGHGRPSFEVSVQPL